jgi:hypothetical protein
VNLLQDCGLITKEQHGQLWAVHLTQTGSGTRGVQGAVKKIIEPLCGGKRGVQSVSISETFESTLDLTWANDVTFNCVYAWCTSTLGAFTWHLSYRGRQNDMAFDAGLSGSNRKVGSPAETLKRTKDTI